MGGVGRAGRIFLAILGIAISLSMVSCASGTRHGVTHVVRPGENLYRISRHYGVSVDSIVRANRIRDVAAVTVGTRLFVPGTRVKSTQKVLAPPAGVTQASRQGKKDDGVSRVRAKRESNLDFSWPVRGRLSSRYGRRKGRPHEGVDIAAKSGTPIRAAEAGRVIHSGWGLGAYGRVVIVKHAGKYSTVYAHNKKNNVSVGDFVERGEIIAQVGATGNARGSHVHFEIRRNRDPQDPIPYLP
jgi:murein DD-endopeptidase MepM/ murein hydrolase activator NlpD